MDEKTVFDETAALRRSIERAPPERQWPVLVLTGETELGQRFKLDRRQTLLGRDMTCDIVLRDNRASRHHARVLYENFASGDAEPIVRIRDLGSTNGTFVNGERLEGEMELHDRDRLVVGSTPFGFFLRDELSLEVEQKLVRMASSDALTGLRNRAYFDMEFAREFARARRHGRELSLTLLDIDHFKSINDTYGHAAGDAVLRRLGEFLNESIRLNDLGARYGGEEFVVLLPETPLENAVRHADRLRQNVSELAFPLDGGGSLSLTISLGCAGISNRMLEEADLLRAADEALYRAKRAGRNRVEVHVPEPVTQFPVGSEDTGEG